MNTITAQTARRIRGAALFALGLVMAAVAPCSGAESGTVWIQHGGEGPTRIQASLYREGKLVRTGEVEKGKGYLMLSQVPAGEYEVRFQAPGFPELVKKIIVTSSSTDVVAEVRQETQVGGGEDRFAALIKELQQLRKEISELRARVERLEGGPPQSKRK